MADRVDISIANPATCSSKPPKDASARDRLVVEYLPLVRRLCRRFSHSGESQEDLVQVGTIGLLKAAERFDPDRGSAFQAFAIPVITGEIKNYFRDHGWAVRVPRKLQRQKLAVGKAIENLSQSLGRSPTVPEIAEATGFVEEEIYDTFEFVSYGKPLSLDAEYSGNGNKEVSCLLDYIGSEDPHFRGWPVQRTDLVNSA